MCHTTYYIYKHCIHSTSHHPYPEFNSFTQPREVPLPPIANTHEPAAMSNSGVSPPTPPADSCNSQPLKSVFEDWSSDEDENVKQTPPAPPPKDRSTSNPLAKTFTTRSSGTSNSSSKRTSPVNNVKAKLSALFIAPSSTNTIAISSSPPRSDDEGVTVDPFTGAAITKCWLKHFNPAKHCPYGLTRREFLLPGKCKRCLGRDATLLRLEGPDGKVFMCSRKEKEWLEKMAAIKARKKLSLSALEDEVEWT